MSAFGGKADMLIALTARLVVRLLMAEIPLTHYVKSDDVHIAYQVLGRGSFDLLFVPGRDAASSMEVHRDKPARRL